MQDEDASVLLNPNLSDLERQFWDTLTDGTLSFQRCTQCGHAWLPARSECPQCLGSQWTREAAKGGATLVSWVVYHHAYHPVFAQRLPYIVAIVQLDEGPRMISNLVNTDPRTLRIDQALRLNIEREADLYIPRFVPA